ncbi:DUF5682 family protein [Nonomuraea maritima]
MSVLGVRHHGPGSARAVRRELERLRPDAILVEGPPEADGLLALAPDLEPPVALLAHVPGDPSRAAFWPFAEFSPEWQAIRYATSAGVPIRFFDLPAAHSLAHDADHDADRDTDRDADRGSGRGGDRDSGGHVGGDAARDGGTHVSREGAHDRGSNVGRDGDRGVGRDGDFGGSREGGRDGDRVRGRDGGLWSGGSGGVPGDPIAALATAAGYDDPERWWEDVVEHRGDTPFEVIAEAMAAVREGYVPVGREAAREAYMRKTLRAARKKGYARIAVICGAWHVPALTGPQPSVAADNAVLRGLPKVKTELTWVPWTYGRLASWSGYGAGITSPGWYHHLFTAPDRPVERWMAEAAAVLRDEGLAVSSAHVIESVRLAGALAVLRGRPLAGLGEVTEAARAVLCEGDDLAVELIQRRMVVGDRIGHVSDGTPMVPLQRDLREQQRRLKLKPEALDREIDLDLRKPLDLDRSHLLHRLRLLDVGWGTPGPARGKGTFREKWLLQWRPEHDLALIEHAALGTTVSAAAARRAADLAGAGLEAMAGSGTGAGSGNGAGSEAGSGPRAGSEGGAGVGAGSGAVLPTLADLTSLVERCLLADLPEALPEVLAALSAKAALDTDVTHLMAALPAMARAHRYGDVRGTSVEGLAAIVRSMLERICVGLPVAVTGLDDDAAAALLQHVDAVHSAVALLDVAPTPTSTPDALSDPVPGSTPDPVPGSTPGAVTGYAPDQAPSSPPVAAPGSTPDSVPGSVSAAERGPGAGVALVDEGSTPQHPEDVLLDGGSTAEGVGEGVSGARGGSGTAPSGAGSVQGHGDGGGGSPRGRWMSTLRSISDRYDLHGLIDGRLTRILLDAGEIDDAGDRMSLAMSRGQTPAWSAAWVEGFLAGGGLLLVHDPRLLGLIDAWLSGLSGDQFVDVLPLLRRTFGGFAAPERRAIGERLRATDPGAPYRGDGETEPDLDEHRAAAAVATVLSILGPASGWKGTT